MRWLKDNDEKLHVLEVPSIAGLLEEYYTARNTGAYSQKEKARNLIRYAMNVGFLTAIGILSAGALHDFVPDMSAKYYNLNHTCKDNAGRIVLHFGTYLFSFL